jgi:DNA-binding MarR family transcriptional regulator
MNQRQIGAIVIILGILLSGYTYYLKVQEDNLIDDYVSKQETCYLDDGTCLHESRSNMIYALGGISLALLLLGFYLIIFDKTQKMLAENQEKIASALQEAKSAKSKKDEFKAFLSGFNSEEQKVLLAVKEQEGILQSTLRYRTGISKTDLSLLLKSLEEREIVSRVEEGKSKKVFLRKKF